MADIGSALKRQLEQKWRALDNFEASVKKLETTRSQWRSKYAIKDGELDAAKVGPLAICDQSLFPAWKDTDDRLGTKHRTESTTSFSTIRLSRKRIRIIR